MTHCARAAVPALDPLQGRAPGAAARPDPCPARPRRAVCKALCSVAVCERDVDVAVVARYAQRFFAVVLVAGQIAFALFDLGLDRKVVVAAGDRAGNVPVFGIERQSAADVQRLKGDAAAVRGEADLPGYGQRGEGDVLVRRGNREVFQKRVRHLQRYFTVLGGGLAADVIGPFLVARARHRQDAFVGDGDLVV